MQAILISTPMRTREEAVIMADMLNRAVARPAMMPFCPMPHGDDRWAVYVRPLYVKHMTVTVPEREED